MAATLATFALGTGSFFVLIMICLCFLFCFQSEEDEPIIKEIENFFIVGST